MLRMGFDKICNRVSDGWLQGQRSLKAFPLMWDAWLSEKLGQDLLLSCLPPR